MSEAWDDLVQVGTIARAHGIRGEVVVELATDFPAERFRPGARVSLKRGDAIETLTVASSRPHRARWLVAFEGIETMSAANTLGRGELRVPERVLTKLPDDTYYQHDLVGCRVSLPSGDLLGTVTRFDESAGAGLLVVGTARGEVLVPLTTSICRSIDTRARTIVVDPPEGLIELNS